MHRYCLISKLRSVQKASTHRHGLCDHDSHSSLTSPQRFLVNMHSSAPIYYSNRKYPVTGEAITLSSYSSSLIACASSGPSLLDSVYKLPPPALSAENIQ